MCSLTTVFTCADLSGDEDHSAVIVEYGISTHWPPVRTDELNSRKRMQQNGNHKDNDQIVVLQLAFSECIACLLICFVNRQVETKGKCTNRVRVERMETVVVQTARAAALWINKVGIL